VHAERVADIGNSRLGDVAIGFSSVTTVPLFTIAIAITNGSCPEHPRFKAMAKPRTGGEGQPRHIRRSRPLGYELAGYSVMSSPVSQTCRLALVSRPGHHAAFHAVRAVAPRFVHKSVHKPRRPTTPTDLFDTAYLLTFEQPSVPWAARLGLSDH
jgi:hypothetical protein